MHSSGWTCLRASTPFALVQGLERLQDELEELEVLLNDSLDASLKNRDLGRKRGRRRGSEEEEEEDDEDDFYDRTGKAKRSKRASDKPEEKEAEVVTLEALCGKQAALQSEARVCVHRRTGNGRARRGQGLICPFRASGQAAGGGDPKGGGVGGYCCPGPWSRCCGWVAS